MSKLNTSMFDNNDKRNAIDELLSDLNKSIHEARHYSENRIILQLLDGIFRKLNIIMFDILFLNIAVILSIVLFMIK